MRSKILFIAIICISLYVIYFYIATAYFHITTAGYRFCKYMNGHNHILPYNLDLRLTSSKKECDTRPFSKCIVPGRLITAWEIDVKMVEYFDKAGRNVPRFIYKRPRDPKIYIKNCTQVEYSKSKGFTTKAIASAFHINVSWEPENGANLLHAKCLDFQQPVYNLLIYPTPIIESLKKRLNVVILQIDGLSSRQYKDLYTKTQNALKLMKEMETFSFRNYWANGYNSQPNMKRMYCGDKSCREEHLLKYYKTAGFATSWILEYTDGLMGHPLQNEGSKFVDKLFAGNYYNKHWKKDLTDMPGMYAWDEYLHMKSLRFLDLFIRDMGPNNQPGSHAAIVVPNVAHTTERLRAKELDGDLANMLMKWKKDGIMEYTFFAIVSDHGIHGSPVNVFFSGEFEHRNPVFEMAVPIKFLNKHREIKGVLNHNTKGIVSHFDFYKSISALANPERWANHGSDTHRRKAYNIFIDKIPADRNCKEAGIPKKWCNCWIEKMEKC